jgi:butyrate kinase
MNHRIKKDIDNGVIMTVNPGTTTTRCAMYEIQGNSVISVCEESIEHPDSEIEKFDDIAEQLDYRFKLIQEFINENSQYSDRIIACAGRGGMLTPVPAGVIKINSELVKFSLETPVYKHASNLGAPLAYQLANIFEVEAFIADPVSVDEFIPVARISGSTEFSRFSFVHALNTRACVRKLSHELSKDFNELSVVVAHLGAGFSISAVHKGRIIDNSNRMECSPFTPERVGGLPPIPLIEACFSGKYTKPELMRKLYGQGGVYGYLGTRDIRVVESWIDQGNTKAGLIFEAMLYQIGKAIGAMASTMDFNIDGIILTGGMANSNRIVANLKQKLQRISPLYIYPGSNENEALAESVVQVLRCEKEYMTWPVSIERDELTMEFA